MNDANKKAVAYIRISSIKQIDNESPETQKEKIQTYADANDIKIVKWFFDEAKSGKNTDRPELNNLIDYAIQSKNNIEYMIVYKMNRASRDLDSYINNVRFVLKARGITVRSATEPVDDTTMGRFMENLFVMLGQVDNEGKSENTIDNMRSLAQQGYWQHPPILGYDSHKILNNNDKLRPSMNPNVMAEKVKLVLLRFNNGDITKAKLTKYAAEIGLRSINGKKLGQDSINRLLKTPEYAGFVHDKFTNYELVEGQHTGIISKEVFEQNISILYPKDTSRLGQIHQRVNKQYTLKNLLLCSNCNKPMYASAPRTGSGGYSARYHCSRTSCRGKVASVKASSVQADFIALLEQIQPSEGILKLYKTILIRETNNSLSNLNRLIKTLRSELNDIDNLKNKTIEKFVNDTISEEEKTALINDLDKKKITKASELQDLERQQNIRESDIVFAINFMKNVDRQWQDAEFDLKQRFQKMLFPDGVIYDSNKRTFGTTNISPLYRYVSNKKVTEVTLNNNLVALVHSNWNLILSELSRWKQLLGKDTLLSYYAP